MPTNIDKKYAALATLVAAGLLLLAVGLQPFMTYAQVENVSWQVVPSPTSATLTSVYTLSETDAWAVGAEGTIIHWDGSLWSNVASPTKNSLRSIDMLNSKEGYCVSFASVTPTNESILRWDGSTWRNVATPRSYLRSERMLNSTVGWAVGYAGLILRWDGVSWVQVETPTNTPLESVDVLDADDAWAVGNNRYLAGIFRWNGTSWSVAKSPIGTSTLWSIDMVNASNGWAVGDSGTIVRWNGTSWNIVASPVSASKHLFSLDMLDSSIGWAVGSDGSIVQWNGASWNSLASPTGNWLSSVSMLNSTYGWIVGSSGSILCLQQESSRPSSFNLTIYDVCVVFALALVTGAIVVFCIKKWKRNVVSDS